MYGKERVDNITRFAWKFIADHRKDNTDEPALNKGVLNLSDEHLRKTFSNSILPLKPKFYAECRKVISSIIPQYKVL